ncbi:sialic acid-binding Ig-like lectin 13 isoform X1 [Lissotriton helveticus]
MGFVRLLVIFFLWKGVLVAPKDYTLTAPWNVTAQEGLCVLIPCQFTYEHTGEAAVTSRGYWFVQQYRENKAVASNDERKDIFEEARGRFKLVGDVRRRDCSLSISDVRRWDGRNYYFKYEHNDYTTTEYSYIHYIVPVTVVVLQDTPEISLPDQVIEGEIVTVECTAPGRCSGTAPEITWSPDPEFKYNQSSYNTYNLDGTRTYTSTITFRAAMEHNNKRLSCTAYFPAVKKYTTSSVSLTVEHMKSPNWLLLVIIGGVVLAGLSLLAWLMISKGRRSMNETSIDTTVHSTYQELQGRQQDIYCELMRDRN